ncbi:sodium:calcium antiporter [Pseudomaricurvus sp.]|uniref:sodium:calcium antiporter n=1 Tax=Pseudomaricurvus sp. TaxID=2004510 RepID=UPI003F6AACE1
MEDAVAAAKHAGMPSLLIGMVIVGFRTSTPEMVFSAMAARKGEHDIGNVVSFNMFNLLAVVGIAGVISPMPSMSPEILIRDWYVMMVMMAGLFV